MSKWPPKLGVFFFFFDHSVFVEHNVIELQKLRLRNQTWEKIIESQELR